MTDKRIYDLTEDTTPASGDYLATDKSGDGSASKVNLNKFLLADGTITGAASQAQDFGSSGIEADVIAESTGAAGVTIDGIKLKDSIVYTDTIAEKTGATGITIDGVLLKDSSIIASELSSDAATPASGKRSLFARDGGWLAEVDDGGYVHSLGWAGGQTLQINAEPTPAMWQHKAAATGSAYGSIRIEAGNGTLSGGTLAVTFQKAFKTILEVFVQDKTGANAMYPSSLAITGFTANGTTTDTFAWLAIGVDG